MLTLLVLNLFQHIDLFCHAELVSASHPVFHSVGPERKRTGEAISHRYRFYDKNLRDLRG